jgi:UDP-N-acetylmuramoyl-L-alanyl-D-glutamate--2,6-diaminopimelate ligase
VDLGQLLAALPGALDARLLDRPAGGAAAVDHVAVATDAPSDTSDDATDTSDAASTEITAVTHDTRAVVPGALFCCVRGQRVDGHDLAPAALAAGAAALLVDRPLTLPTPHERAPQVLVPDVRAAMGPVAAAYWGRPSERMYVVGVTGTSGKTTVTHLVQAILDVAGLPCGIVGTLSGARTTPEATELQALLAAEVAAGRKALAMEVSSHGLDLHRVDATRFAVAVFTNLSHEHLDFHGTMEAYFAAKARLFTPAFTGQAVACADDPWGRRLIHELEARRTAGAGGDTRTPTVTPYGLTDVTDLRQGPGGASFTWRGERVDLRLPGRFNVLNALAAATAVASLGVPVATIAKGLSEAPPVRGRFEPVDAGQPFTVLVDYAHKPVALEHALATARELTTGEGRLWVVFGCGGDRDAAKRPVMGEVAARLADEVVVTSDNPRSEEPRAIISDVQAGIPPGAPVVIEPDRRRAIERALGGARPGDVVLIAGKGHETTQVIGEHSIPFDDRDVARRALVHTWSRGVRNT